MVHHCALCALGVGRHYGLRVVHRNGQKNEEHDHDRHRVSRHHGVHHVNHHHGVHRHRRRDVRRHVLSRDALHATQCSLIRGIRAHQVRVRQGSRLLALRELWLAQCLRSW